MKKALLPVSLLVLVLAGSWFALSCGSSQSPSQLQSVAVAPSAADAQNYPNGEVPFIATGFYTDPDHTVTPLSAAWWTACSENAPTTDVILSQSGMAQCASGAQGTFTIFATAPRSSHNACPAITPCGVIVSGCVVNGTAQLTCP